MGWAERGSPGSEEVNLEREKLLMMESRPGEGRGDNRARGLQLSCGKPLSLRRLKTLPVEF